MVGSIAQRPNGRWRARFRDETGREHARHFHTRTDARLWLDHQSRSHGSRRSRSVSLGSFFNEWSTRQIWTSRTHSAMALAVRSTAMREVPIATVSRADIESWVMSMHASGLAPGTIKTRHTNLRSVFRAAVRDGVILVDPAEGVRLPRLRRRPPGMTIPTPAQVGTLLRVTPEEHRAFVALCAFAGLRLGEAAALQLRDVDALNATITITRQVQRRTGGGHEVSPPKNGSERVVPLAPALADMLSQHISRMNITVEGQWLFSRGGAPASQNSVNYWWRTARRDAGLPEARLHDLRHFYASGLIASGCDVVTVQRVLGHARATTTLNTYAHVWPTSQDKARNAAEQIIESTRSAEDTPSWRQEFGPTSSDGSPALKELR